MLKTNFLILLFIFEIYLIKIIVAADFLSEKPDFLKSCEIKKPQFTKCSTESIQGLFNNIENGIPGFTAIKSFEPFTLNKIRIAQGNSEAVNINVDLSKLKLYGLTKIIVKESKVSSKDFSWKTTLLLPKMKIESDYGLQGRILLIPLNGNGKMILHISDLNVVLYTKTKLYEKGGFTFYNVTDTKIDYNLNGFQSYFTNLFGGNKDLEESTNLFFNENWMMLAEALRPVLTQAIQDVLLDMLQKIFHYIPAQFFVSDIPTPKELYGN
ncbi:circadian clock-controlled protein daywake-like [Condylostylus longicornis]|uniref:circadian clock-controlled protein daywake-like n=1 Tax=Condylostylus longicornis TaxID=2530218 RepID=UPI00244E4CB4|nr:circadian clock-controlled protein daywake-like [Condylostylus longicornis]